MIASAQNCPGAKEYYAALSSAIDKGIIEEVLSQTIQTPGVKRSSIFQQTQNPRRDTAYSVYFEAEDGDMENGKDGPLSLQSIYKEPMGGYQRAAVSVQNACKEYTSKRGTTSVLKNFSMTAKQGTIYSLLGASGCGKTTLLSCVVGLKQLDSGDIHVLGARPGQKQSGVPGKRVGYMPQEIALFREFSIEESLRYYGRMYSMTSAQIEENIIFLIDFLNLPPRHRRICSLSGGQQRRVSFACSMIHNPELLILDEPTVGVDALLRQSIWNHLVKLVSTGKTTVIITTHYIEEARLSNTIGLMRNGKLLVEENPDKLLKKFKTNLLEEIVMKLCLKDSGDATDGIDYGDNEEDDDKNTLKQVEVVQKSNLKWKAGSSGNEEEAAGDRVVGIKARKVSIMENVDHDNAVDSLDKIETGPDEPPNNWRKLHRASVVAELRLKPKRLEELQDSYNRFSTMCYKNFITLLRNIVFLTFVLLCPALQVVTVGVSIGNDPKGLHFAVVNNEVPVNSTCFGETGGCPLNDNYTDLLSCHFLRLINEESIHMIPFENQESALTAIKETAVWGVVTFPDNYTQSLKDRMLFGSTAELDSVFGSRIGLKIDTSNAQIAAEVSKVFYETTQELLLTLSLACGIEPVRSELPLYFDKPVYGHDKMNFREYIAPSVLLGILFFFPVASSGLNVIAEKRLGTLDRSKVAGVTTVEFMAAYTTVQFFVLSIQAIIAFGVLILGFGIEIQGSYILSSAMALLIGVAGISIGFILSLVCSEEVQAVLLAMGMFVPNLLLAGMIWPLEGMNQFLQYFALIFPCTLACEAMRSIISRGVGFFHIAVWPGFITTIMWIIIYWVIFGVIHTIKSRK